MIRYDREDLGASLQAVRAEQGIHDLYAEQGESLVVALMHALHRFGLPGWRMEETFRELCDASGLSGQLLAMPTSLIFAFGEGDQQRTMLLRVQPSAIDLGRLADLDDLTSALVRGEVPRHEARAQLNGILQAGRRWPWSVDLLAGAVASASAAALFDGAGLHDMVPSAVAGVAVAALALGSERSTVLGQVWVMLAAGLSTLVAGAAAIAVPGVHAGVASVAGIILLVPGLSFTITMIELATLNLSSAVARFAAVVLTLVQLAMGVAFARAVLPDVPDAAAATMPMWATTLSLVLLSPAIGVLMGGRPRDLPVMSVTSLTGWAAAWVCTPHLGPVAGAMTGSLALGLASHTYASLSGRPALVPMVTGLFLLVPGSLGFRGMEAMLLGQTLQGVEALFRMGMGAFSLAAGLVLATSLRPPRTTP